MRRERHSTSPIDRILRGIATCAVTSIPGNWILDDQFSADIGSLESDEVQRLTCLLDTNRVIMPVYEALTELDSPPVCKLKRHLEPRVLRIMELKRHRNALLGRIADVLDRIDIEYVFFKTLNRLGSVGVDIDVMIDPSNYQRCVDALIGNGFYLIDDPSKTYATGFMAKANPIIVDMHTELSVLGVRYMSSNSLLRRRLRAEFRTGDGQRFHLNLLNEAMDGLVRMVHCVLKEGAVTIDDVAETSHGLPGNLGLTISYIDEANLRLAASVFSYTALHSLGAEQFRCLITFGESFTHDLAKNVLTDSIQNSIPPVELPVAACILAFIDHLMRRGELGKYVPLLMRSFKYRRNAAHLGRKVLERLGAS